MTVHATRRGLTLTELLLALTITAMTAAAVSSMMTAVTQGVVARRDNNSVMVRANAAQQRVAAYVAPSRCILDARNGDLVLWRADSRESGTVHGTEIRWLLYDAVEGTIDLHFVSFPHDWSQAACDLADGEHAVGSDWSAVLAGYAAQDLVATMTIVDGLEGAAVITDQPNPLAARHVNAALDFTTEDGPREVRVAATLRQHQPPDA